MEIVWIGQHPKIRARRYKASCVVISIDSYFEQKKALRTDHASWSLTSFFCNFCYRTVHSTQVRLHAVFLVFCLTRAHE